LRKLVLPVIGFYNRDSDFAAAQSAEIPKRGAISGDIRRFHPMSALPPKADIGTQPRDVRVVPTGDIAANRVTRLISVSSNRFSFTPERALAIVTFVVWNGTSAQLVRPLLRFMLRS
jgi:hypothetical protein